jgi:hypothetical protein
MSNNKIRILKWIVKEKFYRQSGWRELTQSFKFINIFTRVTANSKVTSKDI